MAQPWTHPWLVMDVHFGALKYAPGDPDSVTARLKLDYSPEGEFNPTLHVGNERYVISSTVFAALARLVSDESYLTLEELKEQGVEISQRQVAEDEPV